MSGIKKLIIVSLLWIMGLTACVAPLHAQTTAINYQQEHFSLKDKDGDKVLLRLFLDTCNTGIKKCILRTNLPPQESQLRVPRFAQENPIVPPAYTTERENVRAQALFDAKATLNNFKYIIQEESQKGLMPIIGQEHSWAERSFVLSKIILALATATSARFMYVGQEVFLIEWIKENEYNSVTMEDLFRKSYQLNNGNVYLTLLTIENVLSDATFEKDREFTIVNQKLTDLYFHSPNKFGDWYHLFGTMLAGYVGEPAETIADLYGIYRRISRGGNAEKSTLAADHVGAKIGGELRTFVTQKNKGFVQRLVEKIISGLDKRSK